MTLGMNFRYSIQPTACSSPLNFKFSHSNAHLLLSPCPRRCLRFLCRCCACTVKQISLTTPTSPNTWYYLSECEGNGGDATTGNSGDVNAGSVVNDRDTVNNSGADSNVAPQGGQTSSGAAVAGSGSGSDCGGSGCFFG
ncbi:unnamed protein product [Somion occarium]|uniref:Uncharacterized protein n=1 Tax=Somion occarium TaxID=3059160 RepID=A0ABP1CPJ7_9APHY